MKIALIDDSTTNLVVLRNLSGRIAGTQCVSFADAEQAIEYLATNDVDLIIVDYSMPKITGIELVKRMRASPRHGMTPIVMVTGSTEMAVHRRAMEVGVTDFLTKPVRAPEFLSRVGELLGVRRAEMLPAAVS